MRIETCYFCSIPFIPDMESFSSATTAKYFQIVGKCNGVGVSLLPLEVPKELQSETEPAKGALDKGLPTRERKGHLCGRRSGLVGVMA